MLPESQRAPSKALEVPKPQDLDSLLEASLVVKARNSAARGAPREHDYP